MLVPYKIDNLLKNWLSGCQILLTHSNNFKRAIKCFQISIKVTVKIQQHLKTSLQSNLP